MQIKRTLNRVLAVAIVLVAATAMAQTYPSKPVRVIVPFPAGGSTDLLGRMVAQRLFRGTTQNIIVENKPGGGTNIGADFVSRSAPDGYTLLMATTTQAVNVTLYPKLTYDLVKGFSAVSPIATSPSVLVAHPSVPAKSVKELVALAKARPGELTYASAGSGSSAHLAGELFKMMAGINLIHIPYKGAPPAQTDIVGGHVHLMFGFTASGVLSHLKAGRLRALGVTSDKRLPDMPDVPTMDEAGVKGYEASVWYGLLAPAGTPVESITLMNAEVAKSVKELAPKLAEFGASPLYSSPAEFSGFIQAEVEKWAPVVRRSGAKVD